MVEERASRWDEEFPALVQGLLLAHGSIKEIDNPVEQKADGLTDDNLGGITL